MQLALIVGALNHIDHSEYLLNCLGKSTRSFKALYDLLSIKNITIEALKLYLKENHFSKYRTDKIVNIFEKKKKGKLTKKYFDLLAKALEIDQKQSYPLVFLEVMKIKKEIPKDINIFWKDFINLIFAIKVKNQSWTENEIDNLLRVDLSILNFGFNRQIIQDNQYSIDIYKTLKESFNFVMSEIKSKELREIFETHFYQVSDSKLNIFKFHSWSLDNIRTLIKRRDNITHLVGFWSNILERRVSRTEFFQYLNQTIDGLYLSKFNSRDYWLISKFFPTDLKRREILKNGIRKEVNSKDSYINWMLLDISERNRVKNWILLKNPIYKKPLFQLKRNYYQELLKSGNDTEFAIYNLTLLGDTNFDYLWWLSL